MTVSAGGLALARQEAIYLLRLVEYRVLSRQAAAGSDENATNRMLDALLIVRRIEDSLPDQWIAGQRVRGVDALRSLLARGVERIDQQRGEAGDAGA